MKITPRSLKMVGWIVSLVGLLALAAPPASGMVGFGVSPPFHLDTTDPLSGIGNAVAQEELRLELFPNPAGSETTFRYFVAHREHVSLSIHDAAGRHVRSMDLGEQSPGRHSVRWDGRDSANLSQPAGILFVRLQVGSAVRSERLVVVR